jgi:class 3 adenylate cyclase
VQQPEVRYVERDGKCLAYAIFGTGPVDLLVFQGSCPIDLLWDLPQLASFMDALADWARVIVYDPRGQGASDHLVDPGVAAFEASADDALAVLDAAGAEQVTIFDMSRGTTGVAIAAHHPHRIRSLIVSHLQPSYPQVRAMTPEQRWRLAKARAGVRSLELENPRVAHDPALRQWWGRARRLLASPDRALAQVEIATVVDVTAALPTLRAPALVLHRRDNPMASLEKSRAAASLIPNARFVELPGSETDLFLGETAPVLAEIQRFLAKPVTDATGDRQLSTVLFTDIVSSTEQLAAHGDDAWRHLLDHHERAMIEIVTAYRGRVIKQLGDGTLATFDGPARAVRCAVALRDAAIAEGLTLRAGLHTGEIEIRPSDVTGIAVHIANRIAAIAQPSEILVSRTVVDLTGGSGLEFDPRGEHGLKGVPGTWPIFAVRIDDASAGTT